MEKYDVIVVGEAGGKGKKVEKFLVFSVFLPLWYNFCGGVK